MLVFAFEGKFLLIEQSTNDKAEIFVCVSAFTWTLFMSSNLWFLFSLLFKKKRILIPMSTMKTRHESAAMFDFSKKTPRVLLCMEIFRSQFPFIWSCFHHCHVNSICPYIEIIFFVSFTIALPWITNDIRVWDVTCGWRRAMGNKSLPKILSLISQENVNVCLRMNILRFDHLFTRAGAKRARAVPRNMSSGNTLSRADMNWETTIRRHVYTSREEQLR